MKIALDYDNTMSADLEFWLAFIKTARLRGHEIKIVTSRHPSVPVPVQGVEIIYCAFTAKRNHYQADVWIDDDPKHIDQDHDMSVFK